MVRQSVGCLNGLQNWVIERLLRFAKKIQNIPPSTVSSWAGRGEEALGLEIANRMESQPIVLSGKTSIRELMCIVKRCAVLLTNDTGPMHVAQALGVPVVAIFGPTDPEATSPFGEAQSVIRTDVRCAPCLLRACPIDHRCMTGISTEQVMSAVMKQIRRTSVSSPLSE